LALYTSLTYLMELLKHAQLRSNAGIDCISLNCSILFGRTQSKETAQLCHSLKTVTCLTVITGAASLCYQFQAVFVIMVFNSVET